MSKDLAEIEDLARARLKFNGIVTLLPVPESKLTIPGLGVQPAATSSNDDASQHQIKYAQSLNIENENSTFFHEFCHVKLSEIGFKKAEKLIEIKISECCDSESERTEMRVAHIFVAETLADSLLYRYFREESEASRDQLDYAYLMSDNLRKIESTFGSQGISQAVGYRIAKGRSGVTEDNAFQVAIEQAFGNGDVVDSYNEMFSALSVLPSIKGDDVIEQMNAKDISEIVACTLKLYEIRTGKKC